MRCRSIPILSLALALATAPAAAIAQAVVQPLPGTTDADRLAEQVRRLAANPQDMDALVTAGDLSIKLDDPTAAAAFFTRADKIDPHSARVKAGEGALLVRNERPGEALRYFAQAESYGLAPDAFASDRGLAYDLIGEQPRAQRDYRLALKRTPGDDEAIRRYALSLGISGKQQQALDTLAPLLTNTDRAAWRARAFVLAMNGDVAGAEHIATTMMPGGIAQGLQPFFQRLPTLDAIDRAFAVHFGEVRTSPERVADARLAPAMTPMPVEPVAVAAVQMPAIDPRKGRKDRRGRPTPQPVAPVQVAQAAALPTIPVPRDQRVVAAIAPTRAAGTVPLPIPSTPTTALASVSTRAMVAAATAASVPATTVPATTVPMAVNPAAKMPTAAMPAASVPVTIASTPIPVLPASTMPAEAAELPATLATAAPPSSTFVSTRVAAPTPAQAIPAPTTPMPTTPVATAPAGPVFGPSVAVVQAVPAARQSPSSLGSGAPLPTPGFAAMTNTAAARRTPSHRPRGEDAVLDKIIAGLSIPASELAVAAGEAKPGRGVRGRPEATPAPIATDEPQLTSAERKAADRKAAAAAKALAAKKAAAAEKAEADKQAAKDAAAEKKAARSNPTRIWVQVAGGANEDDLPKAWAAMRKKAPDVFAGYAGYKTPLRATNRVLTGPFKNDADARAFVNALKKSGVSGFAFTSDAGQKIEKLPSE